MPYFTNTSSTHYIETKEAAWVWRPGPIEAIAIEIGQQRCNDGDPNHITELQKQLHKLLQPVMHLEGCVGAPETPLAKYLYFSVYFDKTLAKYSK